MNPMYLEYNENANMDTDPTMCLNLVLEGCIDMTACNYNELANVDDGSCYTISIELTEYSYDHPMITATVTGAMSAVYNWLLDGETIDGSTNELVPTTDGTYVVIVTDGLCEDSLTSVVNSVGVEELNALQFELYPNPALDKLYISLDDTYGVLQVKVLNSVGAILIDTEFTNIHEGSISLNIEDLPTGVYMLKVSSDTKTTTVPWMKQ